MNTYAIHKIPELSAVPEYSAARLPSSVLNVLTADDLSDSSGTYALTLDDLRLLEEGPVYYKIGDAVDDSTPIECSTDIDLTSDSGVWCSWVPWAESSKNDRNWIQQGIYSPVSMWATRSNSTEKMPQGPAKPVDANDLFVPVPTPVPPPVVPTTVMKVANRGITEIIGIAPIQITRKGRKVTIRSQKDDKQSEDESLTHQNPLHKSSDGSISISEDVNTIPVGEATHKLEKYIDKEPVLDSSGNVVIGSDGKPKKNKVEKTRYVKIKKGEQGSHRKVTDAEGNVTYEEVASSGSYLKDKDTGEIRKAIEGEIGTLRAVSKTIDFVSNKFVVVDKASPLTLNGKPASEVGVADPGSVPPHTYCIGLDGSTIGALYKGDGNTVIITETDKHGNEQAVDLSNAKYTISATGNLSLKGENGIVVYDTETKKNTKKGRYVIKLDGTATTSAYGIEPIVVRNANGDRATEKSPASGLISIGLVEGFKTGILGVAPNIQKYFSVSPENLLAAGVHFGDLVDAATRGIKGKAPITVTPPKDGAPDWVISVDDGLVFEDTAKTYFAATTANGVHTIKVTQAFSTLVKTYEGIKPIYVDPKEHKISINTDQLFAGLPVRDIKADSTGYIKVTHDNNNIYTLGADADKITALCVKEIESETLDVSPVLNGKCVINLKAGSFVSSIKSSNGSIVVNPEGGTGAVNLIVNPSAIEAQIPIRYIKSGNENLLKVEGPKEGNGLVTLTPIASGVQQITSTNNTITIKPTEGTGAVNLEVNTDKIKSGVTGIKKGDGIELSGGTVTNGVYTGDVTIKATAQVPEIGDFMKIKDGKLTIDIDALKKALGSSLLPTSGTGILSLDKGTIKLLPTTKSCS